MARILIAEDDPSMQAVYAAGLKKAGHETWVLDNGIGIENAITEHDVDAVVTDIVMADVEGIEIVITLKKKFPDLPVIAISGNRLYLNSAEKLGATAILKKPFAIGDLLETINTQLAA